MKSILEELSLRVNVALAAQGWSGDPQVRLSHEEQFGDYQSNCALTLAKQLGKKPREVAQAIVERLDVSDLCEPPDIAGPGFINFRLKSSYLARCLESIPPASAPDGARLGIPRTVAPQVIVVDFSSPNLAKEMHVGHLRSTVIGECVCRVLEFAGHTVHRENHVGDWGTQFGMLVAYLRKALFIPAWATGKFEDTSSTVSVQLHSGFPATHHLGSLPSEVLSKMRIADLESLYVAAKACFDADEKFRDESRETVVALQKGDRTIRLLWKVFCDESLRHCHEIYDRLGVKLVDRGESYYNELMEEVIARLETIRRRDPGGPVRESDGALCIFLDGFQTREGDPLPLIVRKSDGGFNYATSDLATIVDRVERLRATRVVYVVGIAQKQHFEMVFAAARKIGWVDDQVTLEHLAFGNMLSATGKPFKTREGGTVKLTELLDEAVERARRVLHEPQGELDARDTHLSEDEIGRIANKVGLAAIKYFDLAHALNSDYKFDWDTMLSLEGNTAPYLLYAYARVRSIGRKAGVDFDSWTQSSEIILEHPSEIALAKRLLRFADVLRDIHRDLRPNLMTDYLFDLAKEFSRFYDRKLGVRVIDAPENLRASRLRLCDLTARTLKLGLGLLGIDTVEQM